jgi:hypothetical protein
LGQKLWQSRYNGTLLAFALLPIVLHVAERLLGIFYARMLAPEMLGEVFWQTVWINNIFYFCIIAFLFLSPQRRLCWLGLVVSTLVYLLTILIVWQPLPIFVVAIYGPLMSAPLIMGLILEYRHTRQNPLLN